MTPKIVEPVASAKIVERVGSALPLILLIAVLMFAGDLLGWFDRFEAPGLDLFARIDAPLRWQTVRIVGIDDADYASGLFNAVSPLDARSVRSLIADIARSHPRVIGVDIDTSGDAWRSIAIDPGWPPIVWSTGVSVDKNGAFGGPIKVLGGRGPTRPQDRAGVPLVTPDFDGVVRRYRNRYGNADAFAWAVVRRYCESLPPGSKECARVPKEPGEEADARLLHVLGNPSDAGTDYLSATDLRDAVDQPNWQAHNPYQQKIVLLGGFFFAGRDAHVTPVRPMQGVELIAQAIENELSGAATPPLRGVLAIALDILAGIALVVINCVFDFFPAVIISLVGVPVLAVAVSFLAFSSSVLWFDFMPMLIGVFLHELYEHAKEHTELRAEHAKLLTEHDKLRVELAEARAAAPTVASP
ncbi:MAG: CHASE2 domain-containing protein [Vulcanimicrobiaceae bacterium]